MHAEIKERWLAALESGNYPQGRRTLADDDGFCCLGVLCEIAVQDQVVITRKQPLTGSTEYIAKNDPYDHSISLLPNQVVDWAMVGSANPNFRQEDVQRVLGDLPDDLLAGGVSAISLSAMNDCGVSFTDIAKVIRELM